MSVSVDTTRPTAERVGSLLDSIEADAVDLYGIYRRVMSHREAAELVARALLARAQKAATRIGGAS